MDNDDIKTGQGDSPKVAQEPWRRQIEALRENHNKRCEHLENRICQLESTVARFTQIFNAIVQDEVLRKFRESNESNLKSANQCATERSW